MAIKPRQFVVFSFILLILAILASGAAWLLIQNLASQDTVSAQNQTSSNGI